MRLLILSFYYPPDLSAGSFRSHALVTALLKWLPEDIHIDVITTLPNRYGSYSDHALELEELPRLTIHRIKLPPHDSGMLTQGRAFVEYARQALTRVEHHSYELVYATSSRLMTASLGAYIARKMAVPLYLDIRDIFADAIKDVLPVGLSGMMAVAFSLVERWTIPQANRVNLVSRGFEIYFKSRYPQQLFSYFPNGIDDVFIDSGHVDSQVRLDGDERLTVLYAGNIGEGQGLHTIVPFLAKRLEGRVVFRVIGDGGRRQRLEKELKRLNCDNVEILPPMRRERLLEAYRRADVLFLHLNDYPAFKRVLPSKVFEYAATGKPLWAGVAGHAASFVKKEIENAAVFAPGNVEQAIRTFNELTLAHVHRTAFRAKYDRRRIMHDMAHDVARLLPIASQGQRRDA